MNDKTLDGYYSDGINLSELWIDEDGNITQKKIHTYSKEGKQE